MTDLDHAAEGALIFADARPALRTRAWRIALTTRRVVTRPTARLRVMPDYLIVGAQRAGTTSLHRYLRQHPGVVPPALTKGVHWFDMHYDRSPAWYRAHFPTTARMRRAAEHVGTSITGEGSPYYMFHPDVPRRIALELPDAKVLVVLRDPVHRAWSQYHHEAARGFEPLTVDDALDAEPSRLADETERLLADPTATSFHHQHHGYVARGQYAEQLERLWAHLGRDRVCVLESTELRRHPQQTYDRVTQFLGLPPWPLDDVSAHNARHYDAIPDHVRTRLAAAFADSNERLFELLGMRYPWTAP